MTAGMGDAGPCHPRDNIALRWLAEELDLGYDIFNTVMQAREQQARNLALFLTNLQQKHGLTIVVHGKASGYISNMFYFSYALSYSEIQNMMALGPSSQFDQQNKDKPPYLIDSWWINQSKK
jgi:hypothetical protein